MYHFGYHDQRNEAVGEIVKSPKLMMTFSGEDRNPVIDPRSGLAPPPSGGGICTYQVPVTVNSDSSVDNNGYSCMWEKPANPGVDVTGRNMMGMSYRDKWEQLRGASTSHKDITLPSTKDDHHSSTMLDTDLQDYRKDAYRSPAKDSSNLYGSHSDSAIDNHHPQIKTPDSHSVSPSRLKFTSPPHSRTVASLDTPKTPSSAMTPVKVSTPIHDKSPPYSSQPTWFGDIDHNSSDLGKRVPFRRQNGNPRHAWTDMEVSNTNHPELSKCHGTTHCRMNYARDNGLVSNVLLAVLCLMMSSFGLVLLLRLTYRTFEGTQIQSGDSMLASNSSYTILKDIAVGLSALVVFLNVWCILTIAIISYLAARLLKCHNGDQRASEFIHQCEVTRVAAAAGAFVSIPVFMLALLLYTIVDYSFVSAVICVVILSSGTTCTIITIIHSTCTWHQQKSMNILPQDPVPSSSPADAQNAHDSAQNHAVNYFELSTLV